ncbi:PREDICTED: importin-4-like [Sturnus vulgaris]|uniref:importin-4-like n=1 Tax=Sturnus vulgaris TaxID=9172 RepID=UPI00071AAD27|nr:PREDICTED: importin-4-like [Sturnus vulgaris]
MWVGFKGCGRGPPRRFLGPVLGALRGGLGDPEGAVRGAAAAALRELREELQVLDALAQGLPPEKLLKELVRIWGVLAALGPAQVGEGLLELLELGLGLAPGDPEATEVTPSQSIPVSPSLQLLSAVSELLGEGTAPLLPRALPLLQGALRPPAPVIYTGLYWSKLVPVPPQPPTDAPDWLLNLHDDEDEDDVTAMEDDVTDWEQAEVGGAFPGLAEAALGALGEVAVNCGTAFLPYLEPSLSAVLDLTEFPQSQVRGAAYEALGSLCCCGRGRETQTAPTPVQQGAFRALLAGLVAEPEVGGALGALGGVGRILQPPGHAPKEWLEPIGGALCDVIAGKVACVRSRGDDEDGDETSQRAELRETASDWLLEVGAAMAQTGSDITSPGSGITGTGSETSQTGSAFPKTGSGVAETGSDVTKPGRGVVFPPHLFRRILPSLLATLADPAHPGTRSWAAAVIGQLGHALGQEATPFLPDLGPAFRLAAGDADPEVRANVFYAIGRIGEAAGHAHQQYPPISAQGAWFRGVNALKST